MIYHDLMLVPPADRDMIQYEIHGVIMRYKRNRNVALTRSAFGENEHAANMDPHSFVDTLSDANRAVCENLCVHGENDAQMYFSL